MKKKIILIISVIIAMLGLFLIWQGLKKASREVFEIAEVKIGTVVQEVIATGTIKPASEIELEFENQGKIKEILVQKGEKVKTGQELIKLETDQLQIQLAEALAGVRVTQAKLAQLLAGSSQEEIKLAETTLAAAQANLEKIRTNTEKDISIAQASYDNAVQNLTDVRQKATNDLAQDYQCAQDSLDSAYYYLDTALLKQYKNIRQKYFGGTDPTSILVKEYEQVAKDKLLGTVSENGAQYYYQLSKSDQRDENIDKALKELKAAGEKIRDALSHLRSAMDEAYFYVTSTDKTTIDTERSNTVTAISALTTAQQAIASQLITNQTNINSAQNSLTSTQESLEAAKAKAQNQITQAEGEVEKAKDQLSLKKAGPREADIQLHQAQVQQAQALANRFSEQIKKMTLRSPIDATVTQINNEIGEMTKAGQPPIMLIGLRDLGIGVDIYEEDVIKLELGMPVDITLVTFPGQIFKGRVIAIEPAEKIIEGVVYYETTIGFEEMPGGIKPGMSVDITIKTAFKENVLTLPKEAIQKKDGKIIVEIIKEKVIKEREIEIGIEGLGGRVEVVSGLGEGERVIIR